jgi:hypothetical protein
MGISSNPGFMFAGFTADGRKAADNYKLQSNSTCINAGMIVPNNGSKDL